MKPSDDVADLLSRFGADTDSYREIEPVLDYTEEPLVPPQALAPLPSPHVIPPQVMTQVMTQQPIASRTDIPASPLQPVQEPVPLRALLEELAQTRRNQAQALALERAQPHVQAKVIAIVSTNGGVGKSTLAGALAITLRRPDSQTIALDLDPQNALQRHLGVSPSSPGIGQASLNEENWQTIVQAGFADVRLLAYGTLEPSLRLSLEHALENESTWLARQLQKMALNERDTVIIDTPSGNTVYVNQALEIADIILVVILADPASYANLEHIDPLLTPYLAREKPALCKFVINQVDSARQLSLDMNQVLTQRLGSRLLGTVEQDDFISESLAYERNPFSHSPNTRGCQNILAIADSLSEQLFL